jgi:ATP-dependent exoDNAse (exonuclease V) beta subunit (contains helicase and exonuclease domains)
MEEQTWLFQKKATNTEGNKALKIYNASAGRGKTYQLVLQFLRIILSNQRDNSIKETMAKTFTNKAAKERKERIISSLLGLANYSEIKDKTVRGYCNQLKEEGYSEKEIATRSKKQ